MYESPIKIICDDMKWHMENNIMQAIQSYDITVDKDELLKALKYDREQYEKGYEDGLKAEQKVGVAKVDMGSETRLVWKCENCGQYMHRTSWGRPVKYCSNCGARLEWSET